MKKTNSTFDTTNNDETYDEQPFVSGSVQAETQDVPLDEIVALTEKLVVIPSVSGEIDKAVQTLEVVKDALIDHKFTPFVINSFPSLFYSNKNTTKCKILLNAHLDVVPGEGTQYVPHRKGDKLFGRGAYDMKGAAAVMIKLFDELADELEYPLGLQIVTDEELAEGACTSTQLAHGVRGEFAIIGECGSNLDIIHENKGLIHASLIATGVKAHGAYLWRGDNAILKMYEAIDNLRKHFPTPNGETKATTINVSKIATNNQTWNQVPDNCVATLDIRFNPQDKDTIVDKVKSLLPEGVTLEIEKSRSFLYSDPKGEYIQALNKAGKAYMRKDLTVRHTYGGSDSVFYTQFGCDAVEFGPVGHGQHDNEEWVSIQGLADYYQILKKFLLSVK